MPLSYTDNGDGAITDNNTGLVWEKLSWDGSIHDVFNFYKWDDAFAVHVATLNSMRFAGHADWRLPNAKELLSIVNYENFFDVFRADIAPPSVFATNCVPGCTVMTCSCTAGVLPSTVSRAIAYWSATTIVSFPTWAWNAFSINPSSAVIHADVSTTKTLFPYGVRAVRGGS